VIPADSILARVQSLPTLPSAVARLAALVRDERSDAFDMEDAIRPDPALTANMLRIANSARFGCSREVRSIRQAVTLMGTKQLFEAAATAGFLRIIPETLPGYGMEAETFWLHCVAVAVLAEHLALELALDAPDLTFTAGLLHDIGKLVIGSFIAEDAPALALRMQNGMSFVAAERDVLGTDHAEVGAQVAGAWNLPPAIGCAAKWHHSPGLASKGTCEVMVDLVHAADALGSSLGYGNDFGGLARRVEPGVVDRLGITPQRLERVASGTFDHIQNLAGVFLQARGKCHELQYSDR